MAKMKMPFCIKCKYEKQDKKKNPCNKYILGNKKLIERS